MITMLHPYPVTYLTNPSPIELQMLAQDHRSPTPAVGFPMPIFIIADEGDRVPGDHPSMDPQEAAAIIAGQNVYIMSQQTLIEVQGTLDAGSEASLGVQWLFSPEGATIARGVMPLVRPSNAGADFKALFRVVNTPGMVSNALRKGCGVLVDIAHNTAHIIGPDAEGVGGKIALRLLLEEANRAEALAAWGVDRPA